MPHLWPTGSSSGWPPFDYSPVLLLMPFGFHLAMDTLPSGTSSGGFRSALAVSGFRLRARLGFSIPSSPGQRGITPAFGYGAPHSSAGGTSTLLNNALLSAHYGAVRLLSIVHHRLRPPAFPTRPGPTDGDGHGDLPVPVQKLPHMPVSTTTPGRHVPRIIATVRVAFCQTENVGAQDESFAAQWLAFAAESARGIAPRAAHRSGREPLDFIRLVPPSEGCRLPSKPSSSSCCQLTQSIPTRVTCPLRSTGITPLHHYYESSPPLLGASVLSASRCCRLCLFPCHRQPGSQVPYESPDESHASCTPDTAWPVSRYLPCCSRSKRATPVLMSS